MRLAPECRACLLSRVVAEAEYAGADAETVAATLRCCTDLYDCRASEPIGASVIAGAVHRCCYAMIGSADPYAGLKVQDNAVAERVADAVRPMLSTVHDYVVAAVIGNAMDYGVAGHEIAKDFTGYFREMFARGLALDDTERILALARRVVYCTDNCGEVVFDKMLCGELRRRGSHVTIVVKDQPMLNDVTIVEARSLGLEEAADAVYHAGGGAQLGLHPELYPPEVVSAMQDATLIIAKGLANYESLTEYEGLPPVAYLMTVKCEPVARHVGAKKGDLIAVLRYQ
ncbi:ARMT1-like domain-containing protein [Methanocorpusculum sp. MG]|uniref:ARMT1-like domain-containing protein n=1 Tax=Methanocorpusculum petauri TaxID=3002863 RepID=A0ABT4IH71_9EURY|nr:ARMT1-like domain-containing protein [Methanocorpusculum petauri]MCZ0861095.1 ARMT1-like domain-containing protein [Methanocorpusculum petauri]MDE2443532.1 ARMT1-like domain-containing protein [Methanocorpusculum sp.]